MLIALLFIFYCACIVCVLALPAINGAFSTSCTGNCRQGRDCTGACDVE